MARRTVRRSKCREQQPIPNTIQRPLIIDDLITTKLPDPSLFTQATQLIHQKLLSNSALCRLIVAAAASPDPDWNRVRRALIKLFEKDPDRWERCLSMLKDRGHVQRIRRTYRREGGRQSSVMVRATICGTPVQSSPIYHRVGTRAERWAFLDALKVRLAPVSRGQSAA